jgi:NADH-quinone oxidoreductase subunit N
MTPLLASIISQTPIVLPKISYLVLGPALVLFAGALIVLLVSALLRSPRHPELYRWIGVVMALGELGLASSLLVHTEDHPASLALAGALANDGFGAVVALAVGAVLVLALLIGPGLLARETGGGPEYVALSLIAASGAVVMGQANDLLVIFLGLEILSIALYVMVGLRPGLGVAREAALKYFLMGGFASAVLLYGIALIYGATGSTNLVRIEGFLAVDYLIHNGTLLAGMALLLVGLAFKVAAAPFHTWSPDVYQGAPTSVTGYMAALAKLGAFAALLRIFDGALKSQASVWGPIVAGLAVASLLVGAFFALRQRDVKRMLAYSSINHAGFILLGVYAADAVGVRDALFYVATYGILVVGSFGALSLAQLALGSGEGLGDLVSLRALAREHPAIAFAFAISLVAQAGAPFTTGFIAKFGVIDAAIGVHETWIAVVAMLSAAVAAAFYLRVVLVLYGRDREVRTAPAELAIEGAQVETESAGLSSPAERPGISRIALAAAWTGVVASLVVTILLGVLPALGFDLVSRAHIL